MWSESSRKLAMFAAYLSYALLVIAVPTANAQGTPDALKVGSRSVLTSESQWSVARRTDHETIWQAIRHFTNAGNNYVGSTTNSIIEIASGLNVRQANGGVWKPASPEFRITKSGATADQAAHLVSLAPNINTRGAVVVTKGTMTFSAHPLCIAYYDPADGRSHLLAEIADSIGWLTATNEIVFSNCFSGLRASIRYRNSVFGLEQDLLFHERPPTDPEELGMSPATRLELFTELLDQTPVPQISDRILDRETDPVKRSSMIEPDFIDQSLDFEGMAMGRGKAFMESASIGTDRESTASNEAKVGKRYQIIDGRRFIIEAIQMSQVRKHLNRLPVASTPTVTNASIKTQSHRSPRVFAMGLPPGWRLLPDARQHTVAPTASDEIQVATSALLKPGLKELQDRSISFVQDWRLMQPSVSGYIFRGTNTYLVSGHVSLAGNTTFEGGTVIKFAPISGNDVSLNIAGTVTCDATNYSPIVLTARDDNLVGEPVPDSTGAPIAFSYGNDYLRFTGPYPVVLKYFRIKYAASYCIRFMNSSLSGELWHSQVLHSWGLWADYGNAVLLRNVLCHDVTSIVEGYNFSANIQHLTAHTVHWTFLDDFSAASSFSLANSVLSEVPIPAGYAPPPHVVWSTAENPSLFQPVGAGSHYIASDNHRNVGTTAIDATLASDLAEITTRAPIVISGTVGTRTTFAPRNIGDASAPDLGYHYPLLDYAVSLEATNTTTVLTNGVAIGIFGDYGFRIRSGQFVSIGSPTRMNHIIPYILVQEQTYNWGNSPISAVATINTLQDNANGWPNPKIKLRFTNMDRRLDGGYHMFVDTAFSVDTASIRDCIIKGGTLHVSGGATYAPLIGITNSLFQDVVLQFYADPDLYIYNNSFMSCELDFQRSETGSPAGQWQLKDNIFDRCVIGDWGDSWSEHANNSYVASEFSNWSYNQIAQFWPIGTQEQPLSALNYMAGPFGRHYLPVSIPGTLYPVLDGGSRLASVASLFHYTTQVTATSKENGSQVDLGAHWIAASITGVPLDSDADGLPDFLEDQNGDGETGIGETSFALADSDGDGISDAIEPTLHRSPLQREANLIWLLP